MRMTPFGHCVQLTFFPRLFPVNCYIVREDDGITLVDTGISASVRDIRQAVGSMDLPVVRILLTHAHGDHVGGLDLLREVWPAAEVLISARDARLLRGDTTLDPGEPQSRIRGGVKPCRTTPTRLLQAGDRVGSLEVVASPGHTPGHMAFLDTRDRSLLAGDAFQTRSGVAVAGTVRPGFPFPAWATWHKPTALQTARELHRLRPSWLAVGHGDVLLDPLYAMERAIAEAERRLSRMEQRLKGTV